MHEKLHVVDLIRRSKEGDEEARGRLFGVLEGELREVARRQMSRQPRGHTLQPTALVNEAYLRLFSGEQGELNGRTHFVKLASRVMRQVLVDHARKRGANKRQSGGRRVELDQLVDELDRRSGGILALDEALQQLQEQNPKLVQLVEMRFFSGRNMREIGEFLGVSERQAQRYWDSAREFLRGYLEEHGT